MTIGFVGSIEHRVVHPNGNMVNSKSAVLDGFPGMTYRENKADGKYQHLNTDATNLIGPDVELLCATGGIPAAQAAARAANGTIPVLLIIGGMPPATGNQTDDLTGDNIAGINLGTSDLQFLFDSASFLSRRTNIGINDIALLVNMSSPAGQDANTKWTTAGRTSVAYDPPNDNDASHIPGVIRANLKDAYNNNGARGLVVSADPFFNMFRNELSREADAAKFAICYPFIEYVNDAQGSHYYGPRLYHEYKRLGTMAHKVLTTMSQAERLHIRQSIGILPATPHHN